MTRRPKGRLAGMEDGARNTEYRCSVSEHVTWVWASGAVLAWGIKAQGIACAVQRHSLIHLRLRPSSASPWTL